MKKNCAACKHAGRSCLPYLFTMPPDDVLEWCKERKRTLHLSAEDISRRTGVPKSTVERILANNATDCRTSTMFPIIALLSGCSMEELDCERTSASDATLIEKVKYQGETISRLEEENKRHKAYIDQLNERAREDLERAKREEAESIAYLKKQCHNKTISATVFLCLFIFTLLVIMVALVVDYANHGMGFFWLK